jgi:hypothetical protein
MTERRPGQWPTDSTPRLSSVPAEPPAPERRRVEVLVPEVRLVAVVDLTGRYDSSSQVSADLYEQTKRSTDCHTAVVRLGEDALQHGFGLAHSIAARFYLSARCIEIEVPAGTRQAYLADEVRRNVRRFCADHAQMTTTLPAPD